MNNKFNELGINKGLEEILNKGRIYEPTMIQELAIPEIIKNNDIIGKAQTGTGKTLAFLLPAFQKIDLNNDNIQCLIIAPTRELALQITNEAEKLTEYKDVNILSVYGGQDMDKQIKKLNQKIHLVIATPGRLLDHLNRKTIDLSRVNLLILDEADEIINMGFFEDTEEIIKKTPKSRQTLLFSATIPKKFKNLAKKIMKNPEYVIAEENVLSEKLEEVKIYTSKQNKLKDLKKYLEKEDPFMAIIFCKTKKNVQDLTTELKKSKYNVDELHGDLSQAKRERAMKNFRDLKTQYLVATDIAARGIDVDGISHVINYDEPDGDVKYTHRIGRTARAGDVGIAVTFIEKKI